MTLLTFLTFALNLYSESEILGSDCDLEYRFKAKVLGTFPGFRLKKEAVVGNFLMEDGHLGDSHLRFVKRKN